jgi:hypothetical protein
MKYIFIYYNIAYIILLVLIYIYVQKVIKNCYKHENFSVGEDLTEVIGDASEESNSNPTQNPASESTSNPDDSPKQTPKTSRQVSLKSTDSKLDERIGEKTSGGPSKTVVVGGGGGPESTTGGGPESTTGGGPESTTGSGPESSSENLISKDQFNKLLKPAGSDKVLSGDVINDSNTVVIEDPTKNFDGEIPLTELTNSSYNYKFKQKSQIISNLGSEKKSINIDNLKQEIEGKVNEEVGGS